MGSPAALLLACIFPWVAGPVHGASRADRRGRAGPPASAGEHEVVGTPPAVPPGREPGEGEMQVPAPSLYEGVVAPSWASRPLDAAANFAQWDEPERDGEAVLTLPLSGMLLPGLVSAVVSTQLELPGAFAGAGPQTVTDGRLVLEGSLVHGFTGSVRGPFLALAVFDAADAEALSHRILADPLTLSDDELRAPLPEPIFTGRVSLADTDPIPSQSAVPIEAEVDTGILQVDPSRSYAYLAIVTDYDLVDPTPEDVLQILGTGGSADLAALARWAAHVPEAPWGVAPDASRRVAEEALRGLCTLRGPPRSGDLQRIFASMNVLQRFLDASLTERFLGCRRRMELVLLGAALSYPEATRIERTVGLPYEGMEHMPSVSSFLNLLDLTVRGLRRRAPARLLRLSFDRLDFPHAAPSLRPSPLRADARAVLAPLTPPEVVPILALAEGDVETERKIFEFYVDAGHLPVVEHLVPWLARHPSRSTAVGRAAVARFPVAMAEGLFDAYARSSAPKVRAHLADLLRELDPKGTAALRRHLASRGVAVPEDAKVARMLADFDAAVLARIARHADRLADEVLHGPDDLLSLAVRVQKAERLAAVSPSHLRRSARALIAFLADAAWRLANEAPGASGKALALLASAPFGTAEPYAHRIAALVRARIANRAGEGEQALAILRAADPHLAHEDLRAAFERVLVSQIERDLAAGRYATASGRIDDFRERTGNAHALADLDRRIFVRRYLPALLLGGVFCLLLLGTTMVVTVQVVRRRLLPFLRARRELASLMYDATLLAAEDEETADDTFLALEVETGAGVGTPSDAQVTVGKPGTEVERDWFADDATQPGASEAGSGGAGTSNAGTVETTPRVRGGSDASDSLEVSQPPSTALDDTVDTRARFGDDDDHPADAPPPDPARPDLRHRREGAPPVDASTSHHGTLDLKDALADDAAEAAGGQDPWLDDLEGLGADAGDVFLPARGRPPDTPPSPGDPDALPGAPEPSAPAPEGSPSPEVEGPAQEPAPPPARRSREDLASAERALDAFDAALAALAAQSTPAASSPPPEDHAA